MLFISPADLATVSKKLVTILVLAAAATLAPEAFGRTYSAREAAKLSSGHIGEFATYTNAVKGLEGNTGCLPIHVNREKQIELFYFHCSDAAHAKDGEPFAATSDFAVTEGLARRVNFWKRIYSLWSIDDYVMHAGEYPEVILEVGRYSDANARDAVKMENTKKVLRERQRNYRKILMSMHYNRKQEPFAHDPVMARIAKLMQHIKHPNKYLEVANSLRVQRGQREFIRSGIENAAPYLPHIELEFQKRGLPDDLAKIAFVESSFNLKAVSKVGASGVYQFMRFTGKKYLRITDTIDERRDPIKAGTAAAQMFASNYKILNNWPLAITAYNHGPYGIKRIINKLGTTDLVKMIDNYSGTAFGFASKNFYSEFLAILATLENKDTLFPEVKGAPQLAFSEYKLPTGMSIATLKKKFNLSTDSFGQYNPDIERRHISRNGWLPKGYVLKIPDKSKEKDQRTASVPNI